MFSFENIELPGVSSARTWKSMGRLKFSNGWTVSIGYGSMMYCDCQRSELKIESCKNAEIAILDPNGNFVEFNDGQSVKGFVTADQAADIIQWVKSRPSEEKQ